jgi:predicted O-methyltransferase YrrM
MNLKRALEIEYTCTERTDELRWLAHQASIHDNIVEIGCFKGTTARAMADNTHGIVTCVDFWPDENIYLTFRENLRDLNNVNIIRRKSVDAAKLVRGSTFDFVFVDADHEYESVRDDILSWKPMIRPGGICAGHDRQWNGVRQAIDELCPGHKVGAGAIWYVQC